MTLRVVWGKCTSGNWCRLNTLDLSSEALKGKGVYIIWRGGVPPRVVYVGQGVIRDRLEAHRGDPRIQAHAEFTLYVTWAEVDANDRDGVEAYLAKACDPLIGERRPTAAPISVNLPWD
jgi:hypothetical protein